MTKRILFKSFLAASIVTLAAGCAPSRKTTLSRKPLPAVPATRRPETIRVAYPLPGQWQPNVDSNFIFGTTGNKDASLTINGYAVPVWKNGAFLAFLPIPLDGTYHLIATSTPLQGGGRETVDSMTVAYHAKSIGSSANPAVGIIHQNFSPPLQTVIDKGSDTLQTGSDVAPGALTPDGNRQWFFPRGARLSVSEQNGNYYKVQLDKKSYAWVDDTNFGITPPPTNPQRGDTSGPATRSGIVSKTSYVDVTFPAEYNAFQITPSGMEIRIHLYGISQPSLLLSTTPDSLIESIGYDSTSEGVDYTVELTKRVWGYKAFYTNDGALTLRIRRPPNIDPGNPLKGIRIMMDPGHPPGGAVGPTGLTEREANLAVALRIQKLLADRGAIVLMTHSTLHGLVSDSNQLEELDARVALATRENVDLMVSTHENAFPDGTNPFLHYGTAAYYFHPFSEALASDLDEAISTVTGIPNLGVLKKSLEICRPTWMPCALTESLYMMFPKQEAELRDPAFLDALAAAHVRGIEEFLREQIP